MFRLQHTYPRCLVSFVDYLKDHRVLPAMPQADAGFLYFYHSFIYRGISHLYLILWHFLSERNCSFSCLLARIVLPRTVFRFLLARGSAFSRRFLVFFALHERHCPSLLSDAGIADCRELVAKIRTVYTRLGCNIC